MCIFGCHANLRTVKIKKRKIWMDIKKNKFQLHEHPWLAMGVEHIVWLSALIMVIGGANLAGVPGDVPWRPLITPSIAHVLVLFVLVPFVLKLPNGKQSFREYLTDIRLINLKPFFPLMILGLSCSLLALLALATQSVAFRISRDLPVSWNFLKGMIPVKNDLPPSYGYISSFPAIFEEVSWRGVMLVLFMRKYSEKRSILITAMGFGLLHFVNLLGGVPQEFVIRQVIMGSFFGIFYGILVLRTNSLMPAMLFHYLVNMFIGSFTSYFQRYAPGSTQILYLLINIPFTTLFLITWVRYFCNKWLNSDQYQMENNHHLAWEPQ
jgi:membrane protease YdiL (CAAX protease family)